MKLSQDQIQFYRDHGYLVVPGVFDPAQVARMVGHYMAMNKKGPTPGQFGGNPDDKADPLNKFPRPINMHGWDKPTHRWATRLALLQIVRQLIDDEPVLNQTMLYYKPPGARGQALHQDQQYITLDPLIGVWVALDDTDKANGQMTVVPDSHKLGMMPVEKADLTRSFTGGQARLPKGAKELGVNMKAGDVLFFDGKTIHGSHPNVTKDRFRRSFICHFVGAHAKRFEPAKGTHMSHL